VDIAWLVGLIVSGGVYGLLSRSLDLQAEEKIIRSMKESDFAAIAQRVQDER